MKILLISDLHFDQRDVGVATKELRTKFESYVKKQKISVDEIFFAGDFRTATNHDESDEMVSNAIVFLKNLSNAVGVNAPEHIHIVPGNHDFERTNKEQLNKVYSDYDYDSGVIERKSLRSLRERFSFFEKCVKQLDSNVWSNFKEGDVHRVKDFSECSVIFLNAVIASGRGSEIDKGGLIIGNNELYKALAEIKNRNINKPIFILSHHSIDCFSEEERRRTQRILKQFDFNVVWICGDSHKFNGENRDGVSYVTVGSFIKEKNDEAGFIVFDISNGKISVETHIYDGQDMDLEFRGAVNQAIYDSFPSALKREPIQGEHDNPMIENSCEYKGLKTINFYSYKGGVGRTGLTMQIARCLAALGKKVVIADFDFKAPSFPIAFAKDFENVYSTENGGLYETVKDYDNFTSQDKVKFSCFEEILETRLINIDEVMLRENGEIRVFPCAYIKPAYWKDVSNGEWSKMLETNKKKEKCGELFIDSFCRKRLETRTKE